MAYTQKHKYGFRDDLLKGDPEKVIYGVYFDDEFEALEEELDKVFNALDPDGDNALLHEAPQGADQPWARDGEAQVWVLTVTFEQYENDITAINNSITTIEGDISTIQGDITTIQGDITTIQGDVTDINNNITEIKGDITDINQNITEIEGDLNTIEGNVNNIINGGTPIAETDPTVPAHVKAITTTQVSNWDTAFGWGNHATAGYLTTFTESDPTVPGHVKAITSAEIAAWNSMAGSSGPDLSAYATQSWVSANYQVKGSYAAASHTHTEYSPTSHNHDGVYQPVGSYAPTNHNHDGTYAPASHTHDYAPTSHNHNGVYAPVSHTHAYVPLSGNSTIAGTLTATDFVATSDMALKMNVERAETGLIDLIDGVTFDWKDSGKAGAGVLAQQLEKVLPDLVHTSDDGTKTVSYLGLLAYMIEEIKALKHGR